MPPLCPTCGRAGVPILFGMPGPDGFAAADAGEIVLGGCLLPGKIPDYQCSERHQWAESDEELAVDEQ